MAWRPNLPAHVQPAAAPAVSSALGWWQATFVIAHIALAIAVVLMAIAAGFATKALRDVDDDTSRA